MVVNFLQFLKDNGIHDFESRLEEEVNEEVPEDWIADAFYWRKQCEGYWFWADLHKKWLKICEKQEVTYGKAFPEVFKR